MDLKDINYFRKLVELKSYKDTAQFFNISQPAISAMVKRLEKELHTELIFQRNSRSQFNLTPAGKILFNESKKLLEIADSIKIETKRANETNFRLGYSELAGKTWLADLISQLNQGHLLASVETHQENSHFLERHLLEGKYDAILFTRLENESFRNIQIKDLAKFEYDLIVPKNSPLAAKEKIDLFEIQDVPLIMRHKRFLSRTALDTISARSGFKPKKKLLVDSIDATLQLISQNMGVGFLMNEAIKNNSNVVAIPLVPSQQIYCYSSLGLRERFIPNITQEKCLQILKNINSDHLE